jgi:hypothetical protein
MERERRDLLAWAALLSALAVTATAEYDLARAVGFGYYVAAGVPAALDIYAVRAFRAGRDVLVVVGGMIAVQALAHLVSAHLLAVSVPLVVAVSTIAPLVLWRVHRLSHEAAEVDTQPVGVDTEVNTQPVEVNTPGEEKVSTTALVDPPAPENPQVKQVDTEVSPSVSSSAEEEAEPERLSAKEAGAMIEQCWADGVTIREAVKLSTRSRSYVGKVYAQLKKDDEREPEPVPGQLTLVKGAGA